MSLLFAETVPKNSESPRPLKRIDLTGENRKTTPESKVSNCGSGGGAWTRRRPNITWLAYSRGIRRRATVKNYFFNGSKQITRGEGESGLLFADVLRCRIQNAPLLRSASELSSGHEGPFGRGGGIRKGDRSVLARTAMRERDAFRKRSERLGTVKVVKAAKLFFARSWSIRGPNLALYR